MGTKVTLYMICETFYFIRYIHGTDLVSMHGICVAITLFKVPFITWHGEIDNGFLCESFHLPGYECFLYGIIHIN